MSMSMTVQSAGGPEWPRQQASQIRRPAEPVNAEGDASSAASAEAAANPYDDAIDALRTAALRRDAALVKTSRTIEANHTTADAAIAARTRPGTKAL
jgi:hypothetical protein